MCAGSQRSLNAGIRGVTGHTLRKEAVRKAVIKLTTSITITLEKAYFCPDSIANLISVGTFRSKGIFIDGANDKLITRDRTICALTYKHNVITLPVENVKPNALIALSAANKGVDYKLLHNRLGHAGKQRILKACELENIIVDKASMEDFHCEACHVAKPLQQVNRSNAI